MKATIKMKSQSPVTMISGYRGLAEHFIKELLSKGHQLSVLVRKKSEIPKLKKRFNGVYFHLGDVRLKKDCSSWVQKTISQFKEINLLINNAAVHGGGGALDELSMDEIEETIDTNLISVIYLTRLLVPKFKKQKSGMIINLSGGGATYPRPYFIPYALSKCAVVRLTECLSLEYPDFRFYAVSPGALMTPMMKKILNMNPKKIGATEAGRAKEISKGKGEDPLKTARLVRWLYENRPQHLNGKLIVAYCDRYDSEPQYPKELGFWTLRRIDEIAIKNLKMLQPISTNPRSYRKSSFDNDHEESYS